MKKGRIVLTVLAFAFAIVTAFASQFTAPPGSAFGFWDPAGTTSDVSCTQGTLTTVNACTASSGTQCHVSIQVGGFPQIVPAFQSDAGVAIPCESDARFRN